MQLCRPPVLRQWENQHMLCSYLRLGSATNELGLESAHLLFASNDAAAQVCALLSAV